MVSGEAQAARVAFSTTGQDGLAPIPVEAVPVPVASFPVAAVPVPIAVVPVAVERRTATAVLHRLVHLLESPFAGAFAWKWKGQCIPYTVVATQSLE